MRLLPLKGRSPAPDLRSSKSEAWLSGGKGGAESLANPNSPCCLDHDKEFYFYAIYAPSHSLRALGELGGYPHV